MSQQKPLRKRRGELANASGRSHFEPSPPCKRHGLSRRGGVLGLLNLAASGHLGPREEERMTLSGPFIHGCLTADETGQATGKPPATEMLPEGPHLGWSTAAQPPHIKSNQSKTPRCSPSSLLVRLKPPLECADFACQSWNSLADNPTVWDDKVKRLVQGGGRVGYQACCLPSCCSSLVMLRAPSTFHLRTWDRGGWPWVW